MIIKHNLILKVGFGFILLILVILSTISFIVTQNLIKSADWVDHTNQVIIKLEKIASIIKDAETGQRGFLLTNEEEFLQPYNGAYKKSIDLVEQFRKLTIDNPRQQVNAKQLKGVLSERLNILQYLLDKRHEGKLVTINDLRKGKQLMDALRTSIDKSESEENRLLIYRLNKWKNYNAIAPPIIIFSALFGITVAVVSYFKIIKDIAQKEIINLVLDSQVQQIASVNKKLVAANEDLSKYKQSLELLNNELEERVDRRTKALFKNEARLQKIMDTLPQIAWTTKPDGEVDFYNQRWFEYSGLDFEQTKEWGWKEVIHPDDLKYTFETFQSIIAGGTGGEFETREKRKDGVYRWHLVRIVAVQDEEDEKRFWVGTATDIEEIKQLQRQKDDFISIASHELKTPITTLQASLQMLVRMKDNPAHPMVPNMIDRANGSVKKLNTLIEDLLNVSKMNQGQLQLNKTSFTISKVIDDCCSSVSMAGEYTISLIGDRELEAYGDPERIDQVVVNFVNNAIKYAAECKKIAVKIERLDNTAKVTVMDKGRGIPSEKIPYLFERYYRVESSGVQYSGLGLGLYICAEIIKKHGGEIGVDSKIGEGSAFWFTLPLSSE